MYQVYLWQRDTDAPLAISDDLRSQRQRAYMRSGVCVSRLQKSVYHALDRLGIVYSKEFRTPDGHSLDAAIESTSVAIEVNGPSHYAEDERSPLGHTWFKAKLLKRAGWELLTLPWWEWAQLTSNAAKDKYLRDRLQKVTSAE